MSAPKKSLIMVRLLEAGRLRLRGCPAGVRWRSRWLALRKCMPAVEPAALDGTPARPARSCCAAWIAGTQEGPCAGQEARHQERHRRPAPAGPFLRAAGQTICYHVHDGSYCDIGGVNELPSRQTSSVGRSGDHRSGCDRRGVRLAGRLAGRRDTASAVKHYLVLPGRLRPT